MQKASVLVPVLKKDFNKTNLRHFRGSEKKFSLCISFVCREILSIITTNKKSTATAPTYTISIIIPKNSAPIMINRIDTLTNTKIKKNTELTVFLEIVTIIAENTVIVEKK